MLRHFFVYLNQKSMTKSEELIRANLNVVDKIVIYKDTHIRVRRVIIYKYECPICHNLINFNENSINKGFPRACKRCRQTLEDHHWGFGTRLFGIWGNMRQRCNNIGYRDYGNYGGRGIYVCGEWDSFVSFRDWSMSNGYSDRLSLDRIDNNGPYSPSNCRWADRITQQGNKRNNLMCTYNGEKRSLMSLANELGLDKKRLRYLYRKHGDVDIVSIYMDKYSSKVV